VNISSPRYVASGEPGFIAIVGVVGRAPLSRLHLVGAGESRSAACRVVAGLEGVEKVLTAMIWVVFSGAGLTRRLTGQLP
jgi:hypothetical protein